jgi:hypothetical protein
VRLVAVSATKLSDLRQQLDDVRFDATFRKPADPDEISATIAELVK